MLMLKCTPKIHGHKGHEGMFAEMGSKPAAGYSWKQPYLDVDHLKHYLLKKEEVDELIDDADDSCYWKIPLLPARGLSLLPAGYDIRNASFGKQAVHEYGCDNAYGLICPKDTPIPKTSPLLEPGYQTDRHYNRPPYDPNQSFGMICEPDKRDVGVECYSTTYNDMVRPGQKVDRRPMAGLPSARFIEKEEVSTPAGICKDDHIRCPDESDVRSCISESNFTLFGTTHRDLYTKRSPKVVRHLFEAAGVNFTDKKFSEIWEEAKKYHSLGWVCYATFKKALDNKTIT